MKKRIPVPYIAGEYINIYDSGDMIANDFSILRNGNIWHMTGITQLKPNDFIDHFNYNEKTIHAEENQLFHCTAEGSCFEDLFFPSSFTVRDNILYASDRPDEIKPIHAPHLLKHNGFFRIFYGPHSIRCADTLDFKTFTRRTLFTAEPTMRDPFLYYEDNLWYMLCAVENRIDCRTSVDLMNWSPPFVLQINPFKNAASESPYLMKRGGYYYLFWAIYDGRNGCYDERTFVFGAESIYGFSENFAPLTILEAHAPEFVSDSSGDYILSVFYPQNGVSAAHLAWK